MHTAAFNALPAHVAVVDADGTILLVNEPWKQIVEAGGLRAAGPGPGADSIGAKYIDLCRKAHGALPQWTEEAAHGIQKVLAGDTNSFFLDYPFRSGGEQRWYRMMVSPCPLDGQRAAIVMHVDITAHALTALHTRTREELNNRIIEAVPAGIVMISNEGAFLTANAEAQRILGLSFDALSRKWVTDYEGSTIWEDGTPCRAEDYPVLKCLRTREPQAATTIGVIRPDGKIVWAIFKALPLIDLEDGRPSGALVTFVDITEQRRLEERLRQSQKMEAVGQLAGGIAHDFNNLLTVILGCTEGLLDCVPPGDPAYRFAADIKLAGQRAASLTKQLLALSRQRIFAPTLINLNVLLEEMSGLLRRLIGDDIELRTETEPNLRLITADPTQITQVILNLAVNARDAMPGGGKLLITARNVSLDTDSLRADVGVPLGDYVVLTVSDTGHGMDKETVNHIFEPFFTTKAPNKGTGLGLSTVYGIVAQSKGHIRVQSEVGHGTTFEVYLPRSEAHAAPAGSPRHPDETSGSETILLVEDEEPVRELLTEVLRRKGHRVLTASSGPEALVMANAHEDVIHLTVTDMVMPRMGGRELARKLIDLRPRMKVLYMSGYIDDPAAHEAFHEPGRAFIQKPFTPEELARKIRELLDG